MTRKVNKLSQMDIDEVSLVDRGANQYAKVLLHKRLEDGGEEVDDVDKASPAGGDLKTDGVVEGTADEDEVTVPVDDKKMEKGFFSRLVDKVLGEPMAVEDADEDVSKITPGMQIPPGLNPQAMGQPAPGPQGMMPGQQAFPAAPGAMPGQMQAGPQLPPEVVQYIQQLEQALAQAQGQGEQPNDPSNNNEEDKVNPFGKSTEDLDQGEVDFLQELAKNLDDEDTREAIHKAMEAVEAANERATQAETIAKAERDIRLNSEYVAKAQGWINLPVDADEFGPVLKRLHEAMSDEDVQVIEKALSAANENLATAGIFTEIGNPGAGFTVVSKVDGEAKALMESDKDLTHEQAVAKALEANPSLYEQYLSETSGRA